MKEKLLVTGGAGFIGTNLIEKLKPNYHIIIIDNFSTGMRSYIDSGVELYDCDIRGEEAWEVAKKSDIIVHLAAQSGVIPSIHDPLQCIDVNVYGTANILQGAIEGKCKKFIFASSGGTVLGMQDPPVHEKTIPSPTSPYGASKIAGESLCQSYYHSFGLKTVILRFGNVYGPWSMHKTGNLIPNFLLKMRNNEDMPIYGDGTQTRDFIYIKDLVDAIYRSILVDGIGGEIFQLANSVEYTVNEVFNVMNEKSKKIFGKTIKGIFEQERSGEVKRNYAIIDKAIRVLGWHPSNDIRTGIEKTFKWYKENTKCK